VKHEAGLGRAAVRGLAWTMLRSVSSRVVGGLVFVVLARLLDPEAFGTIALAAAFIALLSLPVESGFGEALIQRREVTRSDLDTAFWVSNALGVGLALIMTACAAPLGELFDQPELTPVLRVLSLVFVVAALASVPQALLRRELAFREIALRGFAATLAGGAVGVGMALAGWGVWSLVGQILANAVVGTVVLWLACSWRPGRAVLRSSFLQLFRFGANVLGERVALAASRRSDDFLIGLVLGPVALGLYAAAYRILRLVTETIIWTVEGVAFPLFSRLHGDAERAKRAFYAVTQQCSAVAVPVFLALAVLAPELIRVALGPQWLGAIPVMQVLALVGIPHSVTYFNKAVVNAAGRPDLSLRVAIVTGVVNVVGFALVVRWGILAVATSYVACGYLLTPVSIWSVTRVLQIDLKRYLELFVAPITSGLAMVLSVMAARAVVADDVTGVTLVVGLLLVGATAYFLVLYLTGRRLVISILSTVRRLLARAEVDPRRTPRKVERAVTGSSGSRYGSRTLISARIRPFVGRLSWGVADQALSSLTNFAVGIVVARSLGIRELGAFSIAFATYQVAVNASRGLATDPLVVRYSGTEVQLWRRAVGSSTGMATAVGLVAGACCVVAGLLLAGATGAALLALGVTLPGLLLQDSWRFAFFSAGRGGQAFANDLVWGLSLIPMLVAIVASGPPGVAWFILAWGGSATLAAVIGGMQARLLPRLFQARSWLRQHRDLASRYLAENLSISGAYQLRAYGLGAIAGLPAVGALRGAELMLGPFNVILMGIGMMAVPEAVGVLRRSVRELRSFCLLLGCGQAGAAAAWGAALLLLLPRGLGSRVLGPSWRPASELLVPVTLTLLSTGFSTGASAGLRALGAASRSLRAQVIGSAAYVTAGLLGATVAGAAGAAWGAAVATSIGAGVWWGQLHRGLRELGWPDDVLATHASGTRERTAPLNGQHPARGAAVTRLPGGSTGGGRPRVSIGLPVHNGERYLSKAIDALLAQSFTDFELIVSDNASTDSTEEICRRYQALDGRIRYFRQPVNIGAAANHNFVVEQARSEYFKWASHDDLYGRDLLLRCVEALDANPSVVLSHTWEAFIDAEGNILRQVDYRLATDAPSAPERFSDCLFVQGGDDIYGVMRTDILRRTPLHGSYHHAERTVVTEVGLYGPFHQVPEVLYFRRDHPNRAERTRSTKRARAVNLDPRRANRLRHPLVRLHVEYLWGYVRAIQRAPLSPLDRLRCYGHLVRWAASRTLPGAARRIGQSPDPALQRRAGTEQVRGSSAS
jgi:O-antigen/teichoic acid export membrane protein/glycosyltransferase involved in cell wall biosynthesis